MLSIVWDKCVSWCKGGGGEGRGRLPGNLEILGWFEKGRLKKIVALGGPKI